VRLRRRCADLGAGSSDCREPFRGYDNLLDHLRRNAQS
jgi:hypothetical protein